MVDASSAICAMGNHELNALAFHTSDGNGSYIRPQNKKNIKQHAKTLAAVLRISAWRKGTLLKMVLVTALCLTFKDCGWCMSLGIKE